MADISDVMVAIRNVVAAALYPNGVPAGAMPPSIAGGPVRVFWGWPNSSLDADLLKGITQVSVYPRGTVRNLGPYLTGWEQQPITPASMTAEAEDTTVTFAGTSAVPGMIAAILMGTVDAYTYAIQPGDTPATVASALAALASTQWPGAVADGATLTIPGAPAVEGRVVASGSERREVRRVVQGVVIAIWAPTAALRDAVAKVIDDAFLDNRWLALPDGTKAHVTYDGTGFDEEARQAPLHRRDLSLSVEFSTTRTRTAPGIAVPEVEVDPNPAPIRRVVI